jgi:uncharacterized protein (TIGR00369 family)
MRRRHGGIENRPPCGRGHLTSKLTRLSAADIFTSPTAAICWNPSSSHRAFLGRRPEVRAPVKLLAWLDRRAPPLAALARRLVTAYLIPLNRIAGIRVVHVSSDVSRVVLRLKQRAANQNGSGTVHGGVLLALAETAHGVAVLWRFMPGRHTMFTKSARIEYRNPGRGELSVDYRVPEGLHGRIERDLATTSRSKVELESMVVDAQGVIVAELYATYIVLRRV